MQSKLVAFFFSWAGERATRAVILREGFKMAPVDPTASTKMINLDNPPQPPPPQPALDLVKSDEHLSAPHEATRVTSAPPRRSSGNSGNSKLSIRYDGKALVVPMVAMLVACICLAWTLWLLALNVAPNATVNRVMNTEAFENGTFWLLIDPTPSLLAMGIIALGLIAIAYAAVVVDIASSCCRRRPPKVYNTDKRRSRTTSIHNKLNAVKLGVEKSLADLAADPTASRRFSSKAARLATQLSQSESKQRKFMVRCLRSLVHEGSSLIDDGE